MIVIDSSAVVAILLGEPDAAAYAAMIADRRCFMSAVSVYETEIVILGRANAAMASGMRSLLADRGVKIEPFDDRQAALAFAAYARFGKGHHPARLNMGDCAAYALAQSLGLPLLYKGDDFARTDVRSAVTPG